MRKTPYTSVSITPEAVEALRRLSVHLSACVGYRLSMSDTIRAAEKLCADGDTLDKANKVTALLSGADATPCGAIHGRPDGAEWTCVLALGEAHDWHQTEAGDRFRFQDGGTFIEPRGEQT